MKLFLLLSLLSTSCATQMVAPDGTTLYVSECNFVVINCYKKAGKNCPDGYDVKHEETWTERAYGTGAPQPAFKITYACKTKKED